MKHTLYSSFKIETASPIDPRLYVNDITQSDLQTIFGVDGKYGFNKAVLFNKAANKFYYLTTYNSKADVINPSNWIPVGSNVVAFPVFNGSESYGLGSCITFTDSNNYASFYIGLGTIAAGESPETNPELWFDIKAVSNTGGVVSEHYFHRMDPNDINTQDFVINVSSQVSDNGTKYPSILVLADFGRTNSGNVIWEQIFPYVDIYTESGIVKVNIALSGDLSSFNFDANDIDQKNIKVILR
jgi:hypothetical protein